jgi:hypothetical protein
VLAQQQKYTTKVKIFDRHEPITCARTDDEKKGAEA